ncbi:MAG: hypothetical protein RMK98_06130 [Bacteroidia bacterium]|nr:hypothetical protein [Bacteroidia bacterium]
MKAIGLFLSLLWAQSVGIGIALPTARLHVVGTGNTSASTALQVENSSLSPLLVVQDNQRVGIGVATSAQALHVGGNFQFSGTFLPAGNAGSSGHYLHSQGANTPPLWQAVQSGWILWHVDTWDAFNTTAQDWSGSVTTCGAQYMLGGYGQCGSGCVLSKTFTGLPSHQQVMVEVHYWALDSWDHRSGVGVDHVRLDIDGNAVGYAIPGQVVTNLPSIIDTDQSVCGATGWVDRGPFLLIGHANHNSSTLSIDIRAMLNQSATDESLGVTAVYIWLR